MIVKEKILAVEKWGGCLPMSAAASNAKPFYVTSVTHDGQPYKVRSMFYPKGEYIGFDPDSTPDKHGFYLEMGVYNTAE